MSYKMIECTPEQVIDSLSDRVSSTYVVLPGVGNTYAQWQFATLAHVLKGL